MMLTLRNLKRSFGRRLIGEVRQQGFWEHSDVPQNSAQ